MCTHEDEYSEDLICPECDMLICCISAFKRHEKECECA